MALSSMVSKSSSSVVPLAVRAVLCARFLHVSIAAATAAAATTTNNVLKVGRELPLLMNASHRFSSTAVVKKLIDTSLLKTLRLEIKSAEKEDVEKQGFPNTPSVFPFTIKENPGERYITLTREFPDETIEVKVREAVKIDNEEEEDKKDKNETESEDDEDKNETESEEENSSNDDDSCSDDDATSEEEDSDRDTESYLPMTMSISRVDGRSLKFEMNATIDDIKVKYMSLEEKSDPDTKVEISAPDFEQLDGELQYNLMKYLEIRGIKSNYVEFLHKYMAVKSPKDDLYWMKKLRKFIKN